MDDSCGKAMSLLGACLLPYDTLILHFIRLRLWCRRKWWRQVSLFVTYILHFTTCACMLWISKTKHFS